ncbi:NAD(P)/FAD-dependent oxidoreductase [Thermoleophilia bacterium SCSIO 60948]|nr:NAD(P)/FAD-dependent oxidoreductase [Thermoleophilia bacterium SCSIO 60948]
MDEAWDCIVIGGGAAGLSAALVLGRARRKTLVIDAGEPSNAVAPGIGGLLGSDTRPPADYYAAGRDELAAYPSVELRANEVAAGSRVESAFELEMADGSSEVARRVLLATGMDYRLPELPGIEERWGRSVFHCPFCHGWENRDKPLGVLSRGGSLLLRAWSDDVTLFTDGPGELSAEERDTLDAAGVAVDERRVASLHGPGSALTAVEFEDGENRACGGLLIPFTLHQRGTLAEQLGAAPAEPGPIAADAVEVDGSYATSVPGLYAAGDVSTQVPSIASSVAAGQQAAAMVVVSLMTEAPGCAVPKAEATR